MRITYENLIRNCTFVEKEGRDVDYRCAERTLERQWGDVECMTEAISHLLHSWHWWFYQMHGNFSQDALHNCIKKNLSVLTDCRTLNLLSTESTSPFTITTRKLFEQFLEALRAEDRYRSPVAVAKALHLCAPALFPLWDERIRMAYGYHDPLAAEGRRQYLSFVKDIRKDCRDLVGQYQADLKLPNPEIAEARLISQCLAESFTGREHERYEKTLLKLVDEYNYAKYTKHWI